MKSVCEEWPYKSFISGYYVLLMRVMNFIPLFLLPGVSWSQGAFYDISTIQEIAITFNQANWDYQMDTAKNGSEGYILASQVTINGISFDSVGVKYKGNSSYSINRVKNPLHLQLDYVLAGQAYQGFTDIKLSNGWSDPSSIREVMSFKILRNYMDAPESNFARVSVNGSYFGFYANTESINKNFVGKHFYSSGNTLVKCNPFSVGNYLPNLDYLTADSTLYYNRYELKSEYSWKDLLDLCDTLENNPAAIHTILDIDRALWMLAYNNVTVNLDSYSGSFAQNYYLYMDDNRRFDPVIWDLNMNFGGFPNTGAGPQLSLSGMQTMTPLLHSTNPARPLIKQLLANTTYRKMYIAHMRTITSEFFTNNAYQAEATSLQALIDSSVQADPNGLYTYPQFLLSLTTNIGGGPFQIPGIYNLMGARTTYLNATTEFQQLPPVISSITSIPLSPSINDTIWISATVSNSTDVKLGYRYFTPAIFNRIQMFDDGNHLDGNAGDNIYGAGIPASSARIEYYLYAENANAGIFSPERAEHEFYTIAVNIQTPAAGVIRLNEFMAINQSGVTDLEGKNEDWIELYNTTGTPVNLFGLYLSDDPGNLIKWPFPVNAMISGQGYAMVWADEDSSSIEMHCNFKLAGGGEFLYLSTGSGTVLDSVAFGPQLPDVAMARCPDGTGAFAVTYTPTFNASNNCSTSIAESNDKDFQLSIYPNPNSGFFRLKSNKAMSQVDIFNTMGQAIYQENAGHSFQYDINLEGIQPGIYLVRVNGRRVCSILLN